MPNASYGMWPVPSTHSFPVERRCWRSQRLRSCAYHGFEMLFKVQIWNSFPGHQLSHGNLCAFWGCCRWQLKYHPVDLLLRFQWCVWFPLHWRLTGLSSVPQMTCCHFGRCSCSADSYCWTWTLHFPSILSTSTGSWLEGQTPAPGN